jgi:ABC exporter DevB family membrane fusion protein
MTYRLFYGAAGISILILITVGWNIWRHNTRATRVIALTSPVALPSESTSLVVAPGRVEPISEEVEIGTEIPGRVEAVLVQEGDGVERGQVLAVLQRHDYEAQLMAAKARLEQAQAELQRLLNGARQEERREVWAAVEQAKAVLRNAQVEVERRQMLLNRGYIAREEVDRVQRDLRVARARFQAAWERYAFVTADAREDERERAQAAVGLAQAQVREAQAHLDKTLIRSPLNGTVLRRHVHTGEIVSPEAPQTALFIVADTTTLRVRADIDETDIGKLQVGLEAYVTAVAYGDTKFWGRVVQIGQVLGKKNLYTDEPTERVDTKILETLIELDRGQPLVVGLRVDVFITANNDTLAQLSTSHP